MSLQHENSRSMASKVHSDAANSRHFIVITQPKEHDHHVNNTFAGNYVRTAKYNKYNFIFKALFEQFRWVDYPTTVRVLYDLLSARARLKLIYGHSKLQLYLRLQFPYS